jgi:hypothetical protein
MASLPQRLNHDARKVAAGVHSTNTTPAAPAAAVALSGERGEI